MRKLIVTVPVVMMLISAAYAQQGDPAQPPAPKPKPPAPRLTFADKTKLFLQKLGASVDPSKSTADMVVSNYSDPKGGKTTVVVTNDRRKNLVGFYIYNFGSVKGAGNREEVFKYLLSTNDAITLGSFFVDSEDDIGYKYLVSSATPLTAGEFDTIYLTMAAVARERRGEIRQLLGLPVGREEKPADVKKAAEEKPPEKQ
ncbi:MAG TPA: hypothetical protein VJZ91_19410 [Blastocatellia bacterium]|nr:hypothetical protein [Blastocatellia bacterium]